MELTLSHRVLLCTYAHLYGIVDKAVTSISIDWSETHYYIRVYFDREPLEEDIELYRIFITEIAADFPKLMDLREEVIFSEKSLMDLPLLPCRIFKRKEGDIFNYEYFTH